MPIEAWWCQHKVVRWWISPQKRQVNIVFLYENIWVFSKNSGKTPQNGWFIIKKKPIKIDDLGVPLFLETYIWYNLSNVKNLVSKHSFLFLEIIPRFDGEKKVEIPNSSLDSLTWKSYKERQEWWDIALGSSRSSREVIGFFCFYILPETNELHLKNGWLEDYFPFGMLVFGEGIKEDNPLQVLDSPYLLIWKKISMLEDMEVAWVTPPKTNMQPENGPLEKEIPIGNHHFQVPC